MSDSQPAQEQNAEPSNNYQQDLTEKKEASKQKTLEQIAREREEMDRVQRFGFFSIPYPSTVGDQAYSQNKEYENWGFKRDGASMICRLLFEEATDINFFVGRAVNPAHQNPDLPINFNIKMNLVEELSECLRKMGKRIKVSYF